MLRRSMVLGLAASAVLASAGLARAGSNDLSLNTPLYAATAAPKTPLMATLDKVGAGSSLDSAGISITGYVEGGWTYNFDNPSSHHNYGRIFDYEDQDKTLNQVELMISRGVDASKGKFDVGFNVEWIYGGDSRLIHSNGLNFYGPVNANNTNPNAGVVQDGPDQQFDLTQANVVLAIPVGSGLTVTMGKFVTPLGYETINPTTNAFYSHSFLFAWAIPLTQTGVMGKYNINDQMSLMIGMSRGWEQSSNDNNGSPDGFGQLSYKVNDKMNFAVSISCGPQQNDDTSHYRTVVDVVGTYKLGDNTTIGLNADYGYGSREGNDVGFDGKPGTGDWWGTAVYFSQVLDPHCTFNVRAEYFNDDDGCRGLDTALYEITLGVTVHPMPGNEWASGFMIRPEIRWDHANDSVFNDGNDKNQFTVGGDIIFAF